MISAENAKVLKDVQNIYLKPLRVRFNITTLDLIISFLYKDSVLRTRKTLSNFQKLFKNLDPEESTQNPEITSRIWIIEKTLECRIEQDFVNDDSVKDYCLSATDCDDLKTQILNDNLKEKKISHEESKSLIKRMNDILQFGYVITVKDIFRDIIDQIDDRKFKTYREVSDDLFNLSNAMVNIRRNVQSLGSEQTFTLDGEMFENVVTESVTKLKDRNRIFITGIQRFNTLLAPGFLSKRLYTFLAFPGKGKSTILLKSALDIKRYNSNIKTKDPDKRPAVVVLTLENDIPETVERLYNMAVDSDDIRNYSPKQVIKKMRKNGRLQISEKDPIDIIIKEYRNRELDTNDLYTIINDLSDDGVEVIALVVDYMKRICPAERASDEKTELKNITNELKELAKFYDIPVITAQQLNRSGAAVVDSALQAKKADVTRLVGRDSIAGAWEIEFYWSPHIVRYDKETYLIAGISRKRDNQQRSL